MMKVVQVVSKEEKKVWCQRNIELEKHNRYKVKNVYFKERRMDEWEEKKNEIETRYNILLQDLNEDRFKKEEMKETYKLFMKKEQEEKEKQKEDEIKQKRKETAKRRKENMETLQSEPARRSSRIRKQREQ